jgi:hypothetical protein
MNDQQQNLKICINNQTSNSQRVIIFQKTDLASSLNQYKLYVWQTTQLAQNSQLNLQFPIVFQVAGVGFDSLENYRTTNKENVQEGKGWQIVQKDHEAPFLLKSFDLDKDKNCIYVKNDSFTKRSAALFKQNKIMMSLELSPNDDVTFTDNLKFVVAVVEQKYEDGSILKESDLNEQRLISIDYRYYSNVKSYQIFVQKDDQGSISLQSRAEPYAFFLQ